jgi:hypothetical protein
VGAPEIKACLTHLAFKENIAASTHHEALRACLFLFREELD